MGPKPNIVITKSSTSRIGIPSHHITKLKDRDVYMDLAKKLKKDLLTM